MGRRAKSIGQAVWGSEILRDVLAEMWRVYLALLAVVVVAGMGWWLKPADTAMYAGSWQVVEGWQAVERSLDQVYVEPETGQWWWELSESDFNRHRVIYNWKSKPGFHLLAVYGLLGLVGIALVLHWTKFWVLVEFGDREVNRTVAVRGDQKLATLSGTVRITAMRGMIYISGLPDLVTGFEEYGFIFRLAPVRVVVG